MYTFTRLVIGAFARHFRPRLVKSTQGTYVHTHIQIHKISAKNNQAGKDEQLGRASQFSFNSSSLGYVRMLQGLTIYIFRQGLPHWNSAEGLFCSVPWCVVSVIPGTVM